MANKNGLLNGDGVLFLWQKITNKFVAKVEGKGLSSNDYTTEEKIKLHNIAESANKTTVTDNLTSDSATDALSAKQGKELKSQIDSINSSMDNYVLSAKVGQANGVASLGADGKVPESQLPETAPIEHTHEIDEINGLQDELDEVNAIAAGKCKSYVFDTVDDLDAELAKSEFTAGLKTGDVLYIRATDVPDYWWDADTSSKQILETTKVDLPVLSNEEIDAITTLE